MQDSYKSSALNLVDAEQRELISKFPIFDPEGGGLDTFRSELVQGMTALLTPEPFKVEERAIPGRQGDPEVRILLHEPPASSVGRPAIIYLHGGGMISGNADMWAGAHRARARESGALVVAVDYRLAPETPFPGALEDAYAALSWLHGHAAELGVDPERISVMGDSGGGGLAAATALMARDRGGIRLRSQILVYPMLDLRTGGPDAVVDDLLAGQLVWTRVQNRYAWGAVRGQADLSPTQMGYLSPALASDVSGLPPALILVGALDLFRDEAIAYAQRLMRGGVPVDLLVYAGAVHHFDNLPGRLGTRARTDVAAAIKRLI